MSRLVVGVNVSASVASGANPVADARSAEELGFDFVSISDHPGSPHPGYETWTLLTWIAATTTRITVMPRVLGVPLRAPAMTAKAAESLDRLSAGRLILGLGAGGDDAEFASFGLPVHTPAGKLSGLTDAVRIIRGMWARPGFTYDGTLYSTDQAHLEPKPERAIPIWFGTFGPRALQLTGQFADGWIPSRGYVPDAELPLMRRRVLNAAERAGRDPAEIECALNLQIRITNTTTGNPDDPLHGPPEQIVDELNRWTQLGFATFNFGLDETQRTEQLQRLTQEVLPELTQRSP